MYKPTAKGYFSGCGGLEIGVMQAGINIIQSLDLDKEATDCMLLNKKYFDHPILTEDIKNKTVLEQKRADIMLFTYPCTKYSAIADIHGTRTGDDLFLHAFRHIAIEQPEVYVVENVPGMKKFKVVMEAMTKLPNYYMNIFCPVDAANWLPQQRKRLILIGTKRNLFIQSPVKANNIPVLKDILETNPAVEIPDYVLRRIKGKYRDLPIIVDPEKDNAIAPTCVAHYAKDLSTRLVKDRAAKHGIRPFSIREYARLQGFPDDYIFPEKRSSYKLVEAFKQHQALVDSILKDNAFTEDVEIEIATANENLQQEIIDLSEENDLTSSDELIAKLKEISDDGNDLTGDQQEELLTTVGKSAIVEHMESESYLYIQIKSAQKLNRLQEFLRAEIFPHYNDQISAVTNML